MKKVAVTGASGFIGGALADELHRRGYRVRGGSFQRKPAAPYEIVQTDLADSRGIDRLLDGCDTVFHAAALVGTLDYKRENPATIASSNVRCTLNVFDSCVRSGASRCVLLSSTELYSGDGPYVEDSGFRGLPDSSNDGYVWSKRFSEIAAGLFSRQHGIDSAVLRLDNIYGPGEQRGRGPLRAIPAMIKRALAGEDLTVWGDGSQTRSFLFIDDAVDALIVSGTATPNAGPINLSSPETISVYDLAQLILKLTASRARIVLDPARPSGPPARIISTEKAQAVLGFQPKIDLREGITRCIASFRQDTPAT